MGTCTAVEALASCFIATLHLPMLVWWTRFCVKYHEHTVWGVLYTYPVASSLTLSITPECGVLHPRAALQEFDLALAFFPTHLSSQPTTTRGTTGAAYSSHVRTLWQHNGAPNASSLPHSLRSSHATSTEHHPPSQKSAAPSVSSTAAPARVPSPEHRPPFRLKIGHVTRFFRHAPL